MTQLLMIIVIALLSCYKCEVKTKDHSEFFSKNSTSQMKAICALLIVVHHLSATSTADSLLGGIWYFSVLSGYLIVGYFFLVSGYGMAFSGCYANKKTIAKKLLKRILTVIVPYLTITALYCIYFMVTQADIGLSDVRASIVQGDPIVRYSWYSISILVIYVFFAIASMVEDIKKSRVLFFLLLVGYVIICLILDYPEFWYNAIIAVYLGVLLFDFRKQISEFVHKHSLIKFILCSGALLITCLIQIKFGDHLYSLNSGVWWLIKESGLVLFLLMLVFVGAYVDFRGPLLRGISEVSYEIYLTHGFVMMILSKVEVLHQNYLVYSMLVLGATLVLATLEHKINKWIIRGKK